MLLVYSGVGRAYGGVGAAKDPLRDMAGVSKDPFETVNALMGSFRT
jgi:hypothetical protein